MKIKKILFLLSMTLSFQVLSWGQTGHRVTAAIAEHYLTPQAQKAVNDLLVNEDMAEASTYFDEMNQIKVIFGKRLLRHGIMLMFIRAKVMNKRVHHLKVMA
jgi:hypothetical protein